MGMELDVLRRRKSPQTLRVKSAAVSPGVLARTFFQELFLGLSILLDVSVVLLHLRIIPWLIKVVPICLLQVPKLTASTERCALKDLVLQQARLLMGDEWCSVLVIIGNWSWPVSGKNLNLTCTTCSSIWVSQRTVSDWRQKLSPAAHLIDLFRTVKSYDESGSYSTPGNVHSARR